ncbi:sensor histidine kinase [Micropruina sp.]|uniref:sensor histidine kinase n=1 Tax=Micropruina sp. TaxID=2737536 RepID=UPI0039E62CF8
MGNVVRHAAASTCWVRLGREPGGLKVTIADDGTGPPADLRAGVGITAMRERAAELGGTCTVAERPGGGTLVRAVLPIGGPR